MQSLPKISVITASYNNVETIRDTIVSVLNQNYKNIEYIIIDGASVDGTKEMILNNYIEKITKFISEPDKGMYDALNKGIKNASGEIIGFLHADDIYANNDILSNIAQNFNTNIDAVYGDLLYVYKNNTDKILRYWKSGEFNIKKMKKGWMPPHPTFYVKKKIYEKYGGFDDSFKVAADYELITRFLCRHKINVRYIPVIFIKMRWGGKSNKNIRNLLIKMKDDYRTIKKNNVGGLFTLINKNVSKLSQFIKRNE